MINRKYIFAVVGLCAIMSAHGDSLLQATSFPKTFEDVSFKDRYDILAEDYANYDRLYDDKGNCISGCPYTGFTIEQDKQDVDEATAYFAEVIDEVFDEEDYDEIMADNDPIFDEFYEFDDLTPEPDKYNKDNKQDNSSGSPAFDESQKPNRNNIPLGSPVRDRTIIITSGFYFRLGKEVSGFHGAVDIGVRYGTPIYATADGVVAVTGSSEYNGPYIKIKHAGGFYSWYLHLSKIKVSKGQMVKKGQYIGKSGKLGKRSQGAHLDYRISLARGNRDIWIDILCPCRATKKSATNLPHTQKGFNTSTTAAYNLDVAEYKDGSANACPHSAFWTSKYYKFSNSAIRERDADWRIKAGHCMKKASDKLPDEI